MPIWKATPVPLVPAIVLVSFGAFRVDRGDVHLCGYNLTEGEGRVSSPIRSFNRRTRIATTRSGRKYELIGEVGVHPEGVYVLRHWLEINRVEWYEDVTQVLLQHGLRAAKAAPRKHTAPSTN